MPSTGTHGTAGVRNGRFTRGWVRRRWITATHTRRKANSVPMLTISPSSPIGKLAAISATTAPIRPWLANGVRGRVLGDRVPDTGCGLKAFHREAFLALPSFDHMHRFLPSLFLRAGGRVVSVPVNDRGRLRGASKYGVRDRLWVGIVDLLGVLWLQARGQLPVLDDGTGTAAPRRQPRPRLACAATQARRPIEKNQALGLGTR